MEYTVIDMEHYPRRAHFEMFSAMVDPTVGVTAKVDVSRAVRFAREKGCSFYTVFIHIAALAANEVPELRRRTRGNGIIEYRDCPTSHIELKPDGSYCYCTLRHDMNWDEYLRLAAQARARARESAGIEEDPDVDSELFITTLPWIHYEHITMPVKGKGPDNPQICWGKYEPDADGRLMMPLSLYVNHALMDGVHIARFFEQTERLISSLPCAL